MEAIKSGDQLTFERVGVHKATFDPNFVLDEEGMFPLMYATQMGQ